jgi:hypothetical protein
VSPFTIAIFRWSIVGISLLPAILIALCEKPGLLCTEGFGIAVRCRRLPPGRRESLWPNGEQSP